MSCGASSTSDIPLKTEEKTGETAKLFNDTIQCAGWNAMLEHKRTLKSYDCLIIIKQKNMKEEDCREWHRLRTPASKRLLNAATQEQLVHDNKND
jgi:hypothetical protein